MQPNHAKYLRTNRCVLFWLNSDLTSVILNSILTSILRLRSQWRIIYCSTWKGFSRIWKAFSRFVQQVVPLDLILAISDLNLLRPFTIRFLPDFFFELFIPRIVFDEILELKKKKNAIRYQVDRSAPELGYHKYIPKCKPQQVKAP